jgi:hypothetical protein
MFRKLMFGFMALLCAATVVGATTIELADAEGTPQTEFFMTEEFGGMFHVELDIMPDDAPWIVEVSVRDLNDDTTTAYAPLIQPMIGLGDASLWFRWDVDFDLEPGEYDLLASVQNLQDLSDSHSAGAHLVLVSEPATGLLAALGMIGIVVVAGRKRK